MDLLSWDRDRPRFPPELFANIIDHQDQEDLANSSLVCTSWLYFARPRLFSCLRFDERRIRMFIHDPNIIDSPLSTIRPVVKEVVIYNSLPLERAEIRQLLSSLKTVTGLSYCPYCIYPILGQKKLDILAETFHNITALTIVGDFRNFQQLTTFICAFPFITSLDVKAEIGFELATSSYLECRPSPSLRVLRLECNLEGIIPWLLQLDPIPQISELTLKGLIGWGSSHIGRLLRALGPSLKHLTLVEKINVYFASCHDIQSMALGLQSNSELESLQFSCLRPSPSYALTALVVKMILSRATSLSLREISISVNPTLFDPAIWEGIDDTVANLPSPRFEKFTVRTWRGVLHTSSIEQSFPLCHRLGILQVVFFESDCKSYLTSYT